MSSVTLQRRKLILKRRSNFVIINIKIIIFKKI